MKQLTIPTFYKPSNITLCDVMEYVARTEHECIDYRPSRRHVRLAIDLAKQSSPLFKFRLEDNLDVIRRILNYDVDDEYILSTKTFKQILFKEIIIGVKKIEDNKFIVKLKRVKRKRNNRNTN